LIGPPDEGRTHGRDARVTRSATARSAVSNRHGDNGVPPVRGTARSGEADPFQYIKSRIGVGDCQTLQLGSPFDYASQATLFVETDLPEPSDTLRFLPAACDRI